jgi:DNA-binding transcriptional regulator WhiA
MYFRKTVLNPDKNLQSYVIGLAIGDGNLSNPNGRATRLRITCDKNYPLLNQRIQNSLQQLLPKNKIGLINKKGCIDISVYSNELENLLGWLAKGGPKFIQNVSIPKWINGKDTYKINCLKGLMETDGTLYFDRGYKTIMFTTIISDLAKEVKNIITSLGFEPRFYEIKGVNKTRYNIRLSKKVNEFIKLINFKKD